MYHIMKRITIQSLLLISMGLLCTTCKKDSHQMEAPLSKSALKFEVVQDYEADKGGNTIILINNTPETISIWDYGNGSSTRQRDTVYFAFKGNYTIKFSAATDGGIVQADSVVVTVTENNLNYIDDPLWAVLAGGVNQEKTWILDIDQYFFDGPQYFYGTDNGWLEGGNAGCYGTDCWNWNPDYAGNSWIMPYGDYGTMTFNLKGGPYVTINHLTIPSKGLENGTYSLDTKNKTLKLTNASILHDKEREGCVDNWGNIKLFSLTDTTMQLGVLRKASCDGAAYLVYNFVSKDFAEQQSDE